VIKRLDQINNPKSDAIYYTIDSWKWYDSDPDVKAIEAWFESLPKEDFGAIRIGENDDDSEEWGEPYNYSIYIERTLTCPT
jgi:hypothetical protein